jgi:hypothetical protein
MPDMLSRDAIATLTPDDHDESVDAALNRIARRLDDEYAVPATRAARRRRRPRSRRATILFASLCILIVASAAIAAPAVKRHWFGDDPEAPANKMEVFQNQDPAAIVTDLDHMSIFDEKTVPAGRQMGPILKQLLEGSSAARPEHGELIRAQARRLLTLRDGPFAYEMIGVPTTTGRVCLVTGSSVGGKPRMGGAGCGGGRYGNLGNIPVTSGAGKGCDMGVCTPWLYSGLAADGVKSVSVRLGWNRDSLQPAQMGRNAWAWRGSNPTERPRQLVVTFTDGSTRTFSANAVAEDVDARTPPTI